MLGFGIYQCLITHQACLVDQQVKNLPANAGDTGSMPGLGRSPGEGNGNSLQYLCLENPMGRGACWATVLVVAKSRGHDGGTKPQQQP